MTFNAMRDVEPPYLRHNQMASYFEALCVISTDQLWAFFIHAEIFRLLLKISVEKANSMSI